MASVRLRIELNKGRVGVPLAKLSAVAAATVDFLQSLGRDVGLAGGADAWLAENFGNGSVDFDCRYAVALEDQQATRCRSALRMVFANDYADSATAALVRPQTRVKYTRVAEPLALDETVRFGLYQNGGATIPAWYEISSATAGEIQAPLTGTRISYGEIQGIVHSFYKEAKPPYLKVRELSTTELVNCYFPAELYHAAVEVLEDPAAVVFVQGEVTEDRATGLVTDIAVRDFRLAPDFSEDVYRKALGSIPDFTGVKETGDYIQEMRG